MARTFRALKKDIVNGIHKLGVIHLRNFEVRGCSKSCELLCKVCQSIIRYARYPVVSGIRINPLNLSFNRFSATMFPKT